jgi:hypothetical protein
MNDNRSLPASELFATNLLKTTASIELQLTDGMGILLTRSGATQQLVGMVTEFTRPLLRLLAEIEREVVLFASKEKITGMLATSISESQNASLANWVDIFSQLADTPQQLRAARDFREYVDVMIRGKKPTNKEQEKEPRKDKDHER